jgi:uncharacterized protein YdbL (DUF1318 family)
MIYDWNKYGRPRLALASRVVGWFLPILAALSLPFFIVDALRDWTVIFAWLLIVTGTVAQRFGLRKIYRAVPDYAAIAAMEREVYGETFTHEGAPKPDAAAELHAMMDDLADRATERHRLNLAEQINDDRRAMRELAARSHRSGRLGNADFLEEVARLRAKGASYQQIAERFGLTSEAAVRLAMRKREYPPPSNLRWERHS